MLSPIEAMKLKSTDWNVIRDFNPTGYVIEQKYDGHYAQLVHDRDSTRLFNRKGVDISHKHLEIILAAEGLPLGVYLGEITAFKSNKDKRGNLFYLNSLESRGSHNYLIYDVLSTKDDKDLWTKSWNSRRIILENSFDTYSRYSAGRLIRLVKVNYDLKKVIIQADSEDWEGIVLKDQSAPYVPGTRNKVWLKSKRNISIDVFLTSWVKGKKSRHVESFQMAVMKNGKPVNIGNLGTGLSSEIQESLAKRIDSGDTPVVEVLFLSFTGDTLREPRMIATRDDKTPKECLYNQIPHTDTNIDE